MRIIFIICALLLTNVATAGIEQEIFIFFRGDVDGDGTINVSDAIMISSGLHIPCHDSADFDANGCVDMLDSISILNYLFMRGYPPSTVPLQRC